MLTKTYYTREELEQLGFKKLGENIKISKLSQIYSPETMEIGNNSRIDDFCTLTGNIALGDHVHITAYNYVDGGTKGITFEDYSTLAFRCTILVNSDDYLGESMTNGTIPVDYKGNFLAKAINIGRFTIVGTGSTILPGCSLAEGTSVGAMSLITKPTEPWGIYYGIPARRMQERKKHILKLEKQYTNTTDRP